MDEDEPGQRVVFAQSSDGMVWTAPTVLFPNMSTSAFPVAQFVGCGHNQRPSTTTTTATATTATTAAPGPHRGASIDRPRAWLWRAWSRDMC